ncbi:DUF1972 domain-containing protein [Rhodococcus sp. G-MC3]|uniref:DUF1972 domain-containing protein n=1 Tax=Rhodococcus sp. G-MC3 TaxID=3046209 RepID=UPI0024B9755B|nr:glycosyltransferase [Rhodococcus sp. G-MC3]MDJ0396364.1 DUF1972 domain-containing protein [Rhodococcus sp. G-MC3]
MKKKTIAIIGSRGYPSYYGGFETLVRRLAPYLADQGWQVAVYGRKGATRPTDPLLDRRVKSILTPGIETKSLSTLSSGLGSSLHAAWEKPDAALVLNVANGFWLPALKSRGIRTIVNVDGMEWERDKWGRTAKKVFLAGAKFTARYADEVICDSIEIQRRWDDEFGRKGIFIPYGGDTPHENIGVGALQPRKYALMVARFVPENTVAEFITAAERISRSHDVVIVGSSGYGGELEERVRQLDKESNRVHWMGHLSDDEKLFSLWSNAGAYFHGHSVGGTNPALVQAMACGAPIVARDTVYNREVIGSAGLFCQPQPTEIASTIITLLGDSDQQEKLSSSATLRANTDYSWDDICQRYDLAISDLLATAQGQYA